jgi:hypothetical protein
VANQTRPSSSERRAGPPRLTVPADQLRRELDERLDRGRQLIEASTGDERQLEECRQLYLTWTEYNETLLQRSFDGPEPAGEYAQGPGSAVANGPEPLALKWAALREEITVSSRRLYSIKERLPLYGGRPEALPAAASGAEVFVVHGHDGELKATVARFLARLLGREPVILQEQPDRGRTIIEKFEAHAEQAGSAVVLLTADDQGAATGKRLQPRARQNVVFELGFFLAKLGRGRGVVLYERDIELPSDIKGLLCVPIDNSGAWRNALARELQAAGLNVDPSALL